MENGVIIILVKSTQETMVQESKLSKVTLD